MKMKFIAPVLISAIAVSSVAIANAQIQVDTDPSDPSAPSTPSDTSAPSTPSSSNSGTNFYCVSAGRDFATVAERNGVRTAPIFIWRTTEFGRDYTPETRCNLVTDRLNNAVYQNGGRLRNLLLTTGYVNRYPVVCYVNNDRSGCNSQNLLVTLDNRNRQNPDEVLRRLLQFGVTGSGDAVVSLVPNANRNSGVRRGYYSLDQAVNKAFEFAEDDNEPIQPSNPSSNPTRPSNPFEGGI